MTAWCLDWFDGAVALRNRCVWRGVEAQHVVATMRLVDTPAEQDLLEQLLEQSKPPMPATAQAPHYLLATPFRYHPAHASRFRPAHARGQWYGAENVLAVCAWRVLCRGVRSGHLARPPGGLQRTMQTWRCKVTRQAAMFTSGREAHLWNF